METTGNIKNFFETEFDYQTILEETVAAQAQLLTVYKCLEIVPIEIRPDVRHITAFMTLIAQLLPRLRPIAAEVE